MTSAHRASARGVASELSASPVDVCARYEVLHAVRAARRGTPPFKWGSFPVLEIDAIASEAGSIERRESQGELGVGRLERKQGECHPGAGGSGYGRGFRGHEIERVLPGRGAVTGNRAGPATVAICAARHIGARSETAHRARVNERCARGRIVLAIAAPTPVRIAAALRACEITQTRYGLHGPIARSHGHHGGDTTVRRNAPLLVANPSTTMKYVWPATTLGVSRDPW